MGNATVGNASVYERVLNRRKQKMGCLNTARYASLAHLTVPLGKMVIEFSTIYLRIVIKTIHTF